MSDEKTYVVEKKKGYNESDEFVDVFSVLEINRIGETIVTSEDGYGYPNFLYTITEVVKAESIEYANGYIEAMKRGSSNSINSFKHTTNVSSVGAPGNFPLSGKYPEFIKGGK